MGFHARLSADAGGLTDHDASELANDGVAKGLGVSGFVMRNGRALPFTLDTTGFAPEAHRILPEQIIIAGLLLASFGAAVWQLLG